MKKIYFLILLCFVFDFSFGQNSLLMDGGISQINNLPVSGVDQMKLKSYSATADEVVYLRTSTCSNYWGLNGNAIALDKAFGAGNWTRMDFETVNVAALLEGDVKFIFIDGSNCGTCEFIQFMTTYAGDLENWVAAGGALFLNAARNECYDPISLISGVTLVNGGSSSGFPYDGSHQVYLGPNIPALAPQYYGSSWSHDYLNGPDLDTVMIDSYSRPILAEKDFGAGTVMFGGMTLEFFGNFSSWNPEPQVSNFYANILNYMYDASNLKPCIADITQDNDAGECGAVVNYEEPESWSSATITQIDESGLTSGDLFPVGVTKQSYEIDYGTGTDTCSFNVTVIDTTAPEAWCRNIGVALDKEGETRIYPVFLKDSVSDNCGIKSYSIDVDRFDCGDVGKNIVTLTVKDLAGNMASCTSEVTVNDGYAPSVLCRDFEVSLNEEGFAEINADSIDGGSTDACGIAGMELSQSMFTGADLGENIVTLYVTDVNGNTDSCTSVVTVTDAIAPVATCNAVDITITDITGYALSADDLALLAAGSSDNATPFGSLVVEANPSVFTCSQIGDSVAVEVTVIDEAGNESTCETTVNVGFVLAAEVADVEIDLDSGQCETTIDYPAIFTEESCAGLTLIGGLGADGLFPAGTTVESWEVVLGGETDTVSFNVIVNSENLTPTLGATSDTIIVEDETLIVELSGIGDGGDCVAQQLLVSAESLDTELIGAIEVDYEAGIQLQNLSLH